MDANRDGMLSKEGIKTGYLEYFGSSITDEQIEEIFDIVDVDDNGLIDY